MKFHKLKMITTPCTITFSQMLHVLSIYYQFVFELLYSSQLDFFFFTNNKFNYSIPLHIHLPLNIFVCSFVLKKQKCMHIGACCAFLNTTLCNDSSFQCGEQNMARLFFTDTDIFKIQFFELLSWFYPLY